MSKNDELLKAQIEALKAENAKLKAELWTAKDAQLRTYDGLAQKADKYDALKEQAEALVEALEIQLFHINRILEHRAWGSFYGPNEWARERIKEITEALESYNKARGE